MTLAETVAAFSAFCFVAACLFAFGCARRALRREVLPSAAWAASLLALASALILLLPLEERYFPGPVFFPTVWSVLFWPAAVFSFALGAAALSDLSRLNPKPGGEALAWAGILGSIMVQTLAGWVIFQCVAARMPAEKTMEEAARAPLQAGSQMPAYLEYPEFNFRMRRPPVPWIEFDAKKWNKDSLTGFLRAKPNVYFMMVADKSPEVDEKYLEVFADAMISSMSGRSQQFRLLEKRPLSVHGQRGIYVTMSLTISNEPLVYAYWIYTHNGFHYQMVGWVPGNVPRELLFREFSRLVAGFEILDDQRKAVDESLGMKEDYVSPQFGFTLRSTDKSWRLWKELAGQMPQAEAGLIDNRSFGVFVLPVAFLGTDPPLTQMAQALLEYLSIDFKSAAVTDLENIREGDLSGYQFSYFRNINGADAYYKIRILKGRGAGYLIVAHQAVLLADRDPARLEEAMKLVEVKGPAGALREKDLSEEEIAREVSFFNEMGNAFYHEGNKEASLLYYEKAFSMSPEDAVVLGNWVRALRDLKREKEARALLGKHAARFKDDNSLAALDAELLAAAGDKDAARKRYEQLIEKGPEDLNLNRGYLELMNDLKLFDEGVAFLERHLDVKESMEARLMMAGFYLRYDQEDRALAAYEALDRKFPANPSVLRRWVPLLLKRKEYDKAIRVCRNFKDRRGGSAEMDTLEGLAQLQKEDYERAYQAFQSALAADPDYEQAKPYLEYAGMRLGKQDKLEATRSISRRSITVDGEDLEIEETVSLEGPGAANLRPVLAMKSQQPLNGRFADFLSDGYGDVEVQQISVENLNDDKKPLILKVRCVVHDALMSVHQKRFGAIPLVWESYYLSLEEPVEDEEDFPSQVIYEVSAESRTEFRWKEKASLEISLDPAPVEKKGSCVEVRVSHEVRDGALIVDSVMHRPASLYDRERAPVCIRETDEALDLGEVRLILTAQS